MPLQAFATGTPVVTLRARQMRGRITYALYKRMGAALGRRSGRAQIKRAYYIKEEFGRIRFGVQKQCDLIAKRKKYACACAFRAAHPLLLQRVTDFASSHVAPHTDHPSRTVGHTVRLQCQLYD